MDGRQASLTGAIGERLRRSRHRAGRSRLSIGDAMGVSDWTVGRMERGEGDGISVRRWAAAADATGWRLVLGLEPGPDVVKNVTGGPRHLTSALIERIGEAGGWVLAGHDDHVAMVDRPARRERLIVYLCDRPIDVLDAADRLASRRQDTTCLPATGWREASMTVVRAELRDRYRPMDWLADDLAAYRGTGSHTIAALRSARVRMPEGDVIVWCDEQATRLIPFGLDLEPGRRAYRRRPERRRRAAPIGRART